MRPRNRRPVSAGRPSRALALAVLAALPLAGGCGGSSSSRAPAATAFPHDAATLLAAGTGNLEGTPSFRLTMRVAMPKDGGRPAHRLDMSGGWDARRPAGRMDGVLKGTRATVLSIGDSEYVSLPAPVRKSTGKSWLKAAAGTRTFAGFADVHRVAMILRTAERPRVSAEAGARWHVQGVVDRAAALRGIPDPALRAFVNLLPAKTRFDLWTDDAGRPDRIRLALSGGAGKIQGTVELSGFGIRPDVREPIAGQILTSAPKSTK
ncbi:hypothetical protein GCM10010191_20740 [Actinomadura vinacea]|uniref:LppX_LprAFG lipoprotein n=1 Tax=Actinomadura vinacea TaxID=115336 RepID=A0ABP5VTI4_9ACTN